MNIINIIRDNAWLVVLLKVIISIIIYCMLIQFFKGLVKKIGDKGNSLYIKYFNSLIRIILIVLEIYYLLTLFDATKSLSKTLLGGSAVVLAAISFGAQQAMGNIVSGFFISASKPYNLEDKIKVVSGGSILAEGLVKDITIRHTVIETFDGQTCIIPNSTMDSSVIINSTFTENVGNFITVEISYESDIDKARAILKKLIVEHELTLNDDSTSVSISQMNSNGLLLKTAVWTKTLGENFQACSDIRGQIIKEYNKEGIVIPYNTITINKQ